MPTLTPFPADPPRLANGCPVPVEALSLPPTRPTNDLRGIPEHIDYFLYSGGTLPKLEAGLHDWGLLIDGLPPVSGLFYSAEQPAVAVAAHLQDGASSQYNVWVFDCLGRVRYQAFPVAPDPNRRPTRISFVEVDGQPPAELLFTLRSCTARGCHTTWHAIRWVGPNPGDAVDLLRTVPPLADDIAQATLADLTGDGVLELRYVEPARAAPDAPPQRDAIRTWSLAGDAYIQTRVERSAPVYRHQQVRAADEFLLAGDIQGAIDGYRQALLNPALRDWPEGAPSPGAIPVNAFARYRLVQALLAGGQTEAAQQAYTELIFLYPPDTAGGPIAAFARSFWEHYRALPPGVPEESRGARLHAACLSAVESEASEGARDIAYRFGLIENDGELCPF